VIPSKRELHNVFISPSDLSGFERIVNSHLTRFYSKLYSKTTTDSNWLQIQMQTTCSTLSALPPTLPMPCPSSVSLSCCRSFTRVTAHRYCIYPSDEKSISREVQVPYFPDALGKSKTTTPGCRLGVSIGGHGPKVEALGQEHQNSGFFFILI
jgi:hypothetical protein